jgi:hypothetical protein
MARSHKKALFGNKGSRAIVGVLKAAAQRRNPRKARFLALGAKNAPKFRNSKL